MRKFIYTDDKSDKFWEIDLQGNSYTVRYGRVGTDGQIKTKSFDDEDKAASECEKQIKSKLKKKYVEQAVDASASLQAQSTTQIIEQETTQTKTPKQSSDAEKPIDEVALKKESAENTRGDLTQDDLTQENSTLDNATLGLSELDWSWATWRDSDIQNTNSSPQAFDFDNLMSKVTSMKVYKTSYWPNFDWASADIPLIMGDEEATFWLTALKGNRQSFADLKSTLKKADFSKTISSKDIDKEMIHAAPSPWIIRPLYNLLEEPELVSLILCEIDYHRDKDISWCLARGVQHILPLLSQDSIDTLKQAVKPKIDPNNWPSDYYKTTHYFILAAVLGMSEQLHDVVASWDDKQYTGDSWVDHYHKPQEVIFGLGDSELVNHHMRRLKLRLNQPEYIRAWFAHTQTQHLDYIEWSLINETNREEAEYLISAITSATLPELAPVMLSLSKNSKAPKSAKLWLETNIAATISGLISMLGTNKASNTQEVLNYLRMLKRKGYLPLIEMIAKSQSEVQTHMLQQEVIEHIDVADNPLTEKNTPSWLNDGLQIKGKTKPISWIKANDLPPIIIGEHALNEEQVNLLLLQAKSATPELQAFTSVLKEHAERSSLNDFAWSLFEAWLSDGAQSKEKWAMLALGYLGGNESALKITPLIRKWPGESQHQRAVAGLEVLRLIGSKTALMQLSGISQKVKFKGIKTRAQEYMEKIAADKGMSKAELEDMVVPECGLNDKGERVFDYGQRQFHFVLGQQLKPKVKDENGKLRDNPPKPGTKDDPELAPEAEKEWKLLKKQIKEVAKIQAERLEQAMVVGRRWLVDDYTKLIARHPLLTHIARLLLWGAYNSSGELVSTFRLTEEQDFADDQDDPIDLDSFAHIGLIHPLELTEELKNTWGEVFSDYELIPPFLQLGRPVYILDNTEKQENNIKRFEKLALPAPTLVFGLDKLGWTRGEAMDAGGFDEHSKQFPSANITAVTCYEGCVGMGYIEADEILNISRVCFIKGLRPASGYGWDLENEKILTLNNVNSVVLSEVIKDLSQLEAKAQ